MKLKLNDTGLTYCSFKITILEILAKNQEMVIKLKANLQKYYRLYTM